MKKNDTTEWKEYKINELFRIVKGKRLTKANMSDGDINFIGASSVNNGVTAKIGNTKFLHPGNTITVSYNGSVGEAFYQEQQFWASDDINVLYPKFSLNKDIALFITTILKRIGKQYAFVDKWKKEDMEKDVILLPSTQSGNPDFAYMEEYMKDIFEKTKYKLLNQQKINIVKTSVNIKDWKEFDLSDLFDVVLSKGDIQAKLTPEGDIPLISSGKFNNGVCKYISEGDGKAQIFEGNVITTDMFGKSFYQSKNFYAVSHGRVNILLPKFTMSKNTAAFIVGVMDASFSLKYSFSGMCNQKVLQKEHLFLPKNSDGNPDFAYMESYMKGIMEKQRANLDVLQMLLIGR